MNKLTPFFLKMYL